MDKILEKLEAIRVSGGKDYLYNFEAAQILNLIKGMQSEIEFYKDQSEGLKEYFKEMEKYTQEYTRFEEE